MGTMRSANETILRFCEADNVHNALGHLVRGVCDEIEWPVGQAWIVSDDDSGLVCSPGWYGGTEGFRAFRDASTAVTIRDDSELPGRVWSTEQPEWVRDMATAGEGPRLGAVRRSGLHAAVAVPALDGGRPVAVLEFLHPRSMKLDPRLLRSLCALAADVGPLVRRKREEDATRRNGERLERLADVVHDAIWEWDLEAGRLYWNDGLHRHFGYELGTLRSDDAWRAERIHPEDRERVIESLRRAVESGDTRWTEAYRFLRGDGTVTHVVDRGGVVCDADQRPVAMIGAMLDLAPLAESGSASDDSGEDERAA
jgi:PAS domain S-box-containing protein